MKIYIDLLLLAVTIVYIVDLSGFTESWKGALARWLRVGALRPLPPFDCGQCMTWWGCLIYALCAGDFTLTVICWCAFLAFMSTVIGQVLILVREILIKLTNIIFEKL